jgi:hypothetical protein
VNYLIYPLQRVRNSANMDSIKAEVVEEAVFSGAVADHAEVCEAVAVAAPPGAPPSTVVLNAQTAAREYHAEKAAVEAADRKVWWHQYMSTQSAAWELRHVWRFHRVRARQAKEQMQRVQASHERELTPRPSPQGCSNE